MNIYVHIPFCLSKCAYCALYSEAALPDGIPCGFAGLYAVEFAMRAGSGDLTVERADTVYFGGGTPAMLGLEGIETLASRLCGAGLDLKAAGEWSVELNPAPGLTGRDFLEGLRRIGANRASIGVQSFNDDVLRGVGRRHTAEDARAAVARARATGFGNVGIDLIAGLPGETAESWRRSLECAVELDPDHVSVYALIVEPGTAMAERVATGAAAAPDDGELLGRIAMADESLSRAGFVRYEISNWARPGRECRHNLACWRGEDYLGLGPGAASRLGPRRRTNANDWRAWRLALLEGRLPPTAEEDTLDPGDDAEERFIYGLRMAEGVSPADFAARMASCCASPGLGRAIAEAAGRWESSLAAMESIGIVSRAGARWALTRRGMEVADSAIERLMA